jgi:hypothetical protein
MSGECRSIDAGAAVAREGHGESRRANLEASAPMNRAISRTSS